MRRSTLVRGGIGCWTGGGSGRESGAFAGVPGLQENRQNAGDRTIRWAYGVPKTAADMLCVVCVWLCVRWETISRDARGTHEMVKAKARIIGKVRIRD